MRTGARRPRWCPVLAIGVVMGRTEYSADAAHATLKRQSQHTNTPVSEVAGKVFSAFGVPGDSSAPFDRTHG